MSLSFFEKDKGLQEECKKKMQMELSKYGNYDAHFNAIKKFLVDVANGDVM